MAYTQSGDGIARDRLGEGGIGAASFAVGGLPGLAASEKRRAAAQWLQREPDVARLVDGFPGRDPAITALGNAVVPAVSRHIGELIMRDYALGVLS